MAAGAVGRLAAATRQGKAPLVILFFLHAAAMAMVTVPLANVLRAHGFSAAVVTMAFGAPAVAAFISPMLAGSLADRSVAPERLLAGICLGSAALLALTFTTIAQQWGTAWFLGLMMGFALVAAPGFSLVTTIVLSRLKDPQREFGPMRACATWGWLAASFGVSWPLHADASPLSGYCAAGIYVLEACFCLSLKPTLPSSSREPRRLRDFFGWEALQLLRHPDHRMIFLTSALFSALLSSFYRYSPEHLRDLGNATPSLSMSIGQVTESIAMFCLAALLTRFRLKWVLLTSLAGAALRMGMMSADALPWLVASIAFHGPVFVLFYPTTQLYLEQRVDDRLRAQAQALLSLLNSGVGNLSGYVLIGWWHSLCDTGGITNWPRFWAGLAFACAALAVLFVIFYRGQKRAPQPAAA